MELTVLFVYCFVQLTWGRFTSPENLGGKCHDFKPPSKYPVARRNDTLIEEKHGILVADPYRWLEQPDTRERKSFIKAENRLTQSYLKDCQEWPKINRKMNNVWNFEKFSVPQRQGKYYVYTANTGLQNQDILYKQATLDAEPSVLLDPNKLSSDGTVAVSDYEFSEDGHLLAYSYNKAGSDWSSMKIRDVHTGNDYSDVLERIKFSKTTWTYDNKGFFYSRYNNKGDGSETDPNVNQKLYYHRVGETQDKDTLVAEFPENPSWRMFATVTHGGKYALLFVTGDDDENRVYFTDLEKLGKITGKLPLTPVVNGLKSSFVYVTNIGSKVVFQTNRNAPNNRLVVIDLDAPEEKNWSTLIEEDPSDVLNSAVCVDENKILAVYLHDVKSILKVHSLDTGKMIRQFPLEIGEIVSISGGKTQSEFFFQLKSFLTPGIIYRYDFAKPNTDLTVYREVKLNLDGFEKKNFEVKQVFYASRDGTKIPMFIVRKKLANAGPRPTLLYGYGGFRISSSPTFKPNWLFFVNSFDGILAVANIRGGGEYGQRWHDAGRLLNKQNVFNDFQDAAKYLVNEKYTVKEKLAIHGRSNGGLLVGACINQRPDLFGAAIAQVGVMDMLRYHMFTIGAAWKSDYGDPEEKVHFQNLLKYSPLHNVHAPNSSENQYPSTLVMTADHDDRVSPHHSLKFAAALHHAVQGNKYQTNPILLRVYSDAGHGGGKPTSKLIDEETDILTFLYRALSIQIDF